jgi:protein-S-isoprenylcysteine O-methyltransferase Ste14
VTGPVHKDSRKGYFLGRAISGAPHLSPGRLVNRFHAFVAAAACGLAASGCALTFDSSHLGVPVTLASPAHAPATGTPFRVTRHPLFVVWGAFTAGAPQLEDVLAGQLGAGASVSDLRIRVRARWSDLLVTALTAGLFSPRSVTFEGVVVAPPAPTTP